MDTGRSGEINRVSIISIAVNGALSFIKIITGIFAYSQALISDGVDSLGDVLLTLIVILGVNIANKSKDESHPYGHERLESIAAIILSSALIAIAAGIGIRGVKSISGLLAGNELPTPGVAALYIALISIAAKEFLFRYVKGVAERTKSTVLLANAWNFRSDAIASVGSVIGIGGAIMGIKILDPLISVLIALLIVRIAIKIGITGINEVTDHAADKEVQQRIYDTIATVNGVWYIDELKTRMHGNKLFVDVDIAVNSQISVEQAHGIADNVSKAVYSCELGVKECMVHVNPYNGDSTESC